MTSSGIFQILLFLVVLTLLAKPVGIYLLKVYNGEKTLLDFIFKPVERLIYRVTWVDPSREMNWKQYGIAMLVFSLVSSLALYAVQRMQGILPLNPQEFAGTSEHLSFNTAVSFVSNTNWQSYGGETTMSYFTQMTGLALQNFMSAAVGMALAIVFIRGIARFETDKLGNFWVDLTRGVLYVLLPLSFLAAVFFVSQGVVQNFKAYDSAQLTESFVVQVDKKDGEGNVITDENGETVKEDQGVTTQTIAQGPAASQLAIKMLGTNGGGFFNVNSAHPFENPTPFSNFIQMVLIFLIPAGFTYTLGRMVKSQGHGWAVFGAMTLLFLAGTFTTYWAGNNGSAFGGLSANTPWYNTTLGIAMLFGRFFMIIPMLTIAGNLAGKKQIPPSLGTFPVNTPLFTVLLMSVILIVGALTFFPALSLSPILEHFQMYAGQTF